MQVAITDFKAKCTAFVRDLKDLGQPVEVTKRGKVVAVLSLPEKKPKGNPVFGALKDTVVHIAEDFDEPLGDDEWEAGTDDVSA